MVSVSGETNMIRCFTDFLPHSNDYISFKQIRFFNIRKCAVGTVNILDMTEVLLLVSLIGVLFRNCIRQK